MSFPIQRPRRLRENKILRQMTRQTTWSISNLIQPLFVMEGTGIRNPISSMPGLFQLSPDELVIEAKTLWKLGITAVILFGIPASKDAVGQSGYAEDAIIVRAIRALKAALPDLVVIADVCLCEYTSHGHCGVIGPKNNIENDATLDLLSRMATVFARAGADIIAPSDMMDGRVQFIRSGLDAAGFKHLPILSYAVKYASAFYGPFRDAAQSAPQSGDRCSYQMDPANSKEALIEARLDLEEGADILMVKPALAYLDIIKTLSETFDCPIAAYQVSGEYSMIKAAAAQGWIDEKRVVHESLTAIKRAGASLIITYFAKSVAEWMTKGSNKSSF